MQPDQERRWRVELVVTDDGDDDFWREAEGIEPDARLIRYLEGLFGAAQAITKYGLESIEVERV